MFYFIRHPETTWNLEGRMQGSKEGEITLKAKMAAKNKINSLTIKKVTHIYYADNKRTKYLADLLHKRYPGAVLIKEPRLNERDCCVFEGVSVKEIFSENDDIANFRRRYYWKPLKGESHADVSKRVMDFISYLKAKHHSSYVICVTSSGVLRNLIRRIKKLSLEKMYAMKIPNLGIYKFNLG